MARSTTKAPVEPTTYGDRLAQAEAEYLETQRAAHEHLATVQQLPRQAEADLSAAEEALAALEATHAAHDDDRCAPEDYATARAAVDLADIRVRGAEAILSRAERATKPTDRDVAETLRPLLERVMPGVPVVPTTLPGSRLPQPAVMDLPLLVVAQVESTRALEDEALACELVEVHFFRVEAVNARLDGRRLSDIAYDLGHELEPLNESTDQMGPGVCHDVARFRVRKVSSGLPRVAEPDHSAVARELARRIAYTARIPGWSVKLMNSGYQSSHVEVGHGSAKLEDSQVEEGVRTDRLLVTLPMRRIEGGPTVDVAVGQVAQAVSAGVVVSGAGLIQDCEWLDSRGSQSATIALNALDGAPVNMGRGADPGRDVWVRYRVTLSSSVPTK